LLKKLDRLESGLRPKKKSARKHAHEGERQVEQQLTIVKKRIIAKLSRRDATPEQAIYELRRIVGEPTKVS
jgi:hypothetical protein